MAHPTGAGRGSPDPDASLSQEPAGDGRRDSGGPAQPQTLQLTVPALAERVSEVRWAARRFAEAHGVARPDDVALAVGEACANAVVHAYVGVDPGRLELTAAREDGHVHVVVVDDGTGLRPRTDSPGLGLGLPLIAQVTDQFEIGAGDGAGTRVFMVFALSP